MKKLDYKKLKPTLDAKAFEPMDEEERDLLEAEEHGEWTPVSSEESKRLNAELFEAAKNSIARRKMISIKLKVDDLEELKAGAEEKGLGYQTLINSILHQHVVQRLKTA